MPILRPDIYDHNNPIYPIVDANSVKGGIHILPYTVNRVDLGDITYANRKEIPKRHLIEGQTVTEWDVLADPQSITYRLIDLALHDQDAGWEIVLYGETYQLKAEDNAGGASVVLLDNSGGKSIVELLEKAAGEGLTAKNVLIDRVPGTDKINIYHDIVQQTDNEFLQAVFTGSSVLESITILGDHTGHIKSITALSRDMYLGDLYNVDTTGEVTPNILYLNPSGIWVPTDIHNLIDPSMMDTYMVKVGSDTDTPHYLDGKLIAGLDIDLAVDVTDPTDYKVKIINDGPFTYNAVDDSAIMRRPGHNLLLQTSEYLIFQGSGYEIQDFRIDGFVDWLDDTHIVSAKAIRSNYDKYNYWTITDAYLHDFPVASLDVVNFVGIGSASVEVSSSGTTKTVTITAGAEVSDSKWIYNSDIPRLYPKDLGAKVGIGTPDPSHRLDVTDQVRIRTIDGMNLPATIYLTADAIGEVQSRTVAEVMGDVGAERTLTINGDTFINVDIPSQTLGEDRTWNLTFNGSNFDNYEWWRTSVAGGQFDVKSKYQVDFIEGAGIKLHGSLGGPEGPLGITISADAQGGDDCISIIDNYDDNVLTATGKPCEIRGEENLTFQNGQLQDIRVSTSGAGTIPGLNAESANWYLNIGHSYQSLDSFIETPDDPNFEGVSGVYTAPMIRIYHFVLNTSILVGSTVYSISTGYRKNGSPIQQPQTDEDYVNGVAFQQYDVYINCVAGDEIEFWQRVASDEQSPQADILLTSEETPAIPPTNYIPTIYTVALIDEYQTARQGMELGKIGFSGYYPGKYVENRYPSAYISATATDNISTIAVGSTLEFWSAAKSDSDARLRAMFSEKGNFIVHPTTTSEITDYPLLIHGETYIDGSLKVKIVPNDVGQFLTWNDTTYDVTHRTPKQALEDMEGVTASRSLTITGISPISVSPSIPQDLSADRSWTISLIGDYDNYEWWKTSVAGGQFDVKSKYQVDFIEGAGIKLHGSLGGPEGPLGITISADTQGGDDCISIIDNHDDNVLTATGQPCEIRGENNLTFQRGQLQDIRVSTSGATVIPGMNAESAGWYLNVGHSYQQLDSFIETPDDPNFEGGFGIYTVPMIGTYHFTLNTSLLAGSTVHSISTGYRKNGSTIQQPQTDEDYINGIVFQQYDVYIDCVAGDKIEFWQRVVSDGQDPQADILLTSEETPAISPTYYVPTIYTVGLIDEYQPAKQGMSLGRIGLSGYYPGKYVENIYPSAYISATATEDISTAAVGATLEFWSAAKLDTSAQLRAMFSEKGNFIIHPAATSEITDYPLLIHGETYIDGSLKIKFVPNSAGKFLTWSDTAYDVTHRTPEEVLEDIGAVPTSRKVTVAATGMLTSTGGPGELVADVLWTVTHNDVPFTGPSPTPLIGAFVYDSLTVNATGHLTAATARELTASDIGAADLVDVFWIRTGTEISQKTDGDILKLTNGIDSSSFETDTVGNLIIQTSKNAVSKIEIRNTALLLDAETEIVLTSTAGGLYKVTDKHEFTGSVKLNTVANSAGDFLTHNLSNIISRRSPTEALGDMGGVPDSRKLTISGVGPISVDSSIPQDLSVDRSWLISFTGDYDNYEWWRASVAGGLFDVKSKYQVSFIEGSGIKIHGSLGGPEGPLGITISADTQDGDNCISIIDNHDDNVLTATGKPCEIRGENNLTFQQGQLQDIRVSTSGSTPIPGLNAESAGWYLNIGHSYQPLDSFVESPEDPNFEGAAGIYFAPTIGVYHFTLYTSLLGERKVHKIDTGYRKNGSPIQQPQVDEDYINGIEFQEYDVYINCVAGDEIEFWQRVTSDDKDTQADILLISEGTPDISTTYYVPTIYTVALIDEYQEAKQGMVLGKIGLSGYYPGKYIENTHPSAYISATATEDISSATVGSTLEFWSAAKTHATAQLRAMFSEKGNFIIHPTSTSEITDYPMLIHGETYIDGALRVKTVPNSSGQFLTWSNTAYDVTHRTAAEALEDMQGVPDSRKLTITGISPISIIPSGPPDLSGDRSWIISFDGDYDNYGGWRLKVDTNIEHNIVSDDLVTFTSGPGIILTEPAAKEIKIAHGNTSIQGDIPPTSRTYINKVTLDGFGHVTELGVGTETVTDTNDYLTAASFDTATGGITFNVSSKPDVIVDINGRYIKYTEANRTVSASNKVATMEDLLTMGGEYFVAYHDPTGTPEYPDTSGETNGAYWIITGLGAGNSYTFTSGDLVGQTVMDGYKLLSDGTPGTAGQGLQIIIPPAVAWGGIAGTLSDQLDLQDALDAKAPISHISDYSNPHQVTYAQLGSKPIITYKINGQAGVDVALGTSPVDIPFTVDASDASKWESVAGNLYPKVLSSKVGIGTSAPAAQLEVAGDTLITGTLLVHTSDIPQLEIRSSAAGDSYSMLSFTPTTNEDFYLVGYGGTHSDKGKFAITAGSSIGTMGFFVGGSSYPTHERLSIASNGNIGIGQTSPAYKLDINGDLRVTVIDPGTADYNKHLVSDGGEIKYRTSAELAIDIGFTDNYMFADDVGHTDPNLQKISSGYGFNPNANNPTTASYSIVTFGNNSDVVGQLATHYERGALYSRAFNTEWTPWIKYADENWVTSNFDKYTQWKLYSEGIFRKGVIKEGIVDFVGGANVTIAYSANKLTFSSVNTDTNTTYGISAESATGGANLRLTGSDSSIDDVKFQSGTGTTVSRIDANTIEIGLSGGGNFNYIDFAADSGTTSRVVDQGELKIVGGNHITTSSEDTTDTITINHGTYAPKTVDINNSAGVVIQDVTASVDGYGHVTALTFGSVDLDVRYTTLIAFNAHINDATIHFTKGSISHTEIQDIGTYTHPQIDTHIAATNNPHSVTLDQLLSDGISPQYLWYDKTWRTIQYNDISDVPIIDNSKWDRNSSTGSVYPKTLTDKVGIGIDAPEYKLDVSGDMRVSSTVTLLSVADATSANPVMVMDGSTVKKRQLTDLKDDLGISDLETRPTAPAGLVLTEYADYVEIAFTGDTNNDFYEVYASETASDSDFNLVGRVPRDQITSSVVFTDNTYTIKGQLWYKVYAVRHGLVSDPAEETITTTNNVPDVTGLTIITDAHHFHAQWDNPEDRRLASVKVSVQFNITDSGWDENTATTIYQGLRGSVVHEITAADKDKFIKVWATTITRT